jgi:hypothetical protein
MGFPPPFVGVAEKVTDAPGQKGLDDAAMVTPAGNPVFSIIRTWMLDAGLPDVQGSEDVSMQETWSPFIGKKVKFGLLIPAVSPFTFHR